MDVTYKATNTFTAEGVTLMPGLNSVEDDAAEKFMECPGVKARVKSGVIVMAESKAADKKSVADWTAEIEQTFDRARLVEMQGDDSLPKGAQKAVEAQISKIDAAATAEGGQTGS